MIENIRPHGDTQKIVSICKIGMLLIPCCNSLAAHAFTDPFRAANYLRGDPLYHWDFLSLDGKTVTASNGLSLANAVAYYIFHERLRGTDEIQQSPSHEPVGYAVPKLLRDSIILMERNLEEPLRLPEIANHVGTSQRQVERLFTHHTGVTPVRYYINVRLDRARGLVTQTQMPLAEIAGACGFGSSEQFTRSYKKRFRITPGKDRTEGRIPFQFRSYPAYDRISNLTLRTLLRTHIPDSRTEHRLDIRTGLVVNQLSVVNIRFTQNLIAPLIAPTDVSIDLSAST